VKDRHEHPLDRWDRMPWFVRWPLVIGFIAVVLFLVTAPLHPWMPPS
jgi:hypothetical protein